MTSLPGRLAARPTTVLALHVALLLAGAAAAVAEQGLGVVACLLPAALLDAVPRGAEREGARDLTAVLMDRRLGLTLRGLVLLAYGVTAWTSWLFYLCIAVVAVVNALTALVVVVHGDAGGLGRLPASRSCPGVGSVRAVSPPPVAVLPAGPELCLLIPAAVVPDRPVLVAALGVVGLLVGLVGVGGWALRVRGALRGRGGVLRAMRTYLVQEKPTVILYVGDGPGALHEAAVWFPTLERVSCDVLVLMRSRPAFDRLPPTSLPVLCVPAASDLLALPVDQASVALFVSNIGNNIHLLRVPGLRSAFIGHGDSDKSASANPYSKVYDEVWVAGPAGADRYLRAGVGLRPEALVEVGRPQVELVRSGDGERSGVPTLLYAPTWEGWSDEQDYCSIATHGLGLVRAALSSSPPVRLIYRPHPYTGRRNRSVAQAHRRIVDMLMAAGDSGTRAASVRLAAGTAQPAPPSSGSAHRDLEDEVLRGEAALHAVPASAHIVVDPGAVPLVSCMNVAAGMVTDVSSVLTDFLPSDKPVAVCNTGGTSAEDFVRQFPTAAAAEVLPPEPAAAHEFFEVAAGHRPDARGDTRATVRARVLGPPEPSPTQRFDTAIIELARRARSRERDAGTGQEENRT